MDQRKALTVLAAVAAVEIASLTAQAPRPAPFDLDEVTIAELQNRMETGRETARSLVEKYLARIDAVDRHGPALRSVLEVNPDAAAIADGLDAERRAGRVRGPLHGIPILIKDNIATGDRMMTTAGSLALGGAPAARRRVRRRTPAGRGRGDSRQDEPQRVGELPVDALVERLERTRRTDEESVRARSQPVRFEFRLRRRGRGQPERGGRRHRDRRLDRLAVEQRRARRHQADARA